MLRSIGKQYGESVESVQEKKMVGYGYGPLTKSLAEDICSPYSTFVFGRQLKTFLFSEYQCIQRISLCDDAL